MTVSSSYEQNGTMLSNPRRLADCILANLVSLSMESPGEQRTVGEVTECNQKPGTSWLLSVKGEDPDSPLCGSGTAPHFLLCSDDRGDKESKTHHPYHVAKGFQWPSPMFTLPNSSPWFYTTGRYDFPPASYTGKGAIHS